MQDYEQVQDTLRILAIDGIEGGAGRFRIGAVQPKLCPSVVAGQDQDRPGLHRNIATQENARNIVKTVIDLCRNLKFDCVVEGVETAEQVEIIGRLGCSTMQGYFFAKPMPQSEVETFIAGYRMPDDPRMAAAAG